MNKEDIVIKLSYADASASLARYNRPAVIKIDIQANRFFNGGLGETLEDIQEQVDFVLFEYGGLSSKRSEGLVNEIALSIMENREDWVGLLSGADEFELCNLSQHDELRANPWTAASPQPIHFIAFENLIDIGGGAQTRCLTKLLHLLKPKAFVIQDKWIGGGISADVPNFGASESYNAFVACYLDFIFQHHSILTKLYLIDSPKSWSDIKLVDKILLCRNACLAKGKLAA